MSPRTPVPRPKPSGAALPDEIFAGFAGAPMQTRNAPGPLTEERARAVLATVPDPEIPSVMLPDLGVIRGVAVTGDAVTVRMSPTYTGCPATDLMQMMIREQLTAAGFASVTVDLVLSPPWSSDDITAEGRRKMAAAGIAPPAHRATDKRHLTGTAPDVSCPHCGSADTVMTSAFGATACKALWRCHACQEPFDYFKCI